MWLGLDAAAGREVGREGGREGGRGSLCAVEASGREDVREGEGRREEEPRKSCRFLYLLLTHTHVYLPFINAGR